MASTNFSLLNWITSTTPQSAQTNPFVTTAAQNKSDRGEYFARLLQDTVNSRTAARDLPPRSSAGDANSRALSAPARALLRDFSRDISPQDARDALARIDSNPSLLSDTGLSPESQQQVIEFLHGIVDSQEPATVGDLAAQIAVAQASALSPPDPATTDRAASDATGTPPASDAIAALTQQITALSRGIAALLGDARPGADRSGLSAASAPSAPDAQVADTLQQALSDQPQDPVLQALNTLFFRPHARGVGLADTNREPGEKDQKTGGESEVFAVLTPLAQTLSIPLSTPGAPTSNTLATTSGDAAATSAIDAGAAITVSALPGRKTPEERALLDTLVPPLEAPQKDAQSLLPVTLPATGSEATPDALAAQPAPLAPPAPGTQLPANAAWQNTGPQTNSAEQNTPAKPAAALAAIGGVSAVSQLTAPIGAQSVTGTASVLGATHINRAPIADQVQYAIVKGREDGLDRVTLQLDPVELGRVEVKLHMAADGATSLQFLVDKPETFDLLSRDARHLERSLQEAGIKADTGSMQFNLRQQPQQSAQFSGFGEGNGGQRNPQPGQGSNTANDPAAGAQIVRQGRIRIHDGVDIEA